MERERSAQISGERPPVSPCRLFFAVDPPAGVRSAVAQFARDLPLPADRIRPVRPEGYHLTLRFLGDRPAGEVELLCEVGRRVAERVSPMLLTLAGVGVFPDEHRPRVIWVGVVGDTDALKGLEGVLFNCLENIGISVDCEPFVPHLTIARIPLPHGMKEAVATLIRACRETEFGPFPVNELILYESLREQGGVHYVPRGRFPLCGPAGG